MPFKPSADTFPWQESFEEICSFQAHEVAPALQALASSEVVQTWLEQRFDYQGAKSSFASELSDLPDVNAFQNWLRTRLAPKIHGDSSRIKVEGLAELDPSQGYIFISNHHDILMDPFLINLSLMDNGFESAHCAIGDNLLQNELSTAVAKLNKCFCVKRSFESPRDLLKAMKVQSSYIAHLRFEAKEHVWIAQKEGRSKDNVDVTNPALIKMLNLSKPKGVDTSDYLSSLNIVPVAISYEWDPCDVEKAKQLQRDAEAGGKVEKHSLEDYEAVHLSMFGQEGKISVRYGAPIKATGGVDLDHLNVAAQIDNFIYANSECFASHVAAYLELNDNERLDDFGERLSSSVIDQAKTSLYARIEKEPSSIRDRVLAAYAEIVDARLRTR